MDSSSRTYRFLPADLYTAGYRIVGKVMAGTSGIMGTMNDRTKSHLEVHDARLARIHMPTKLVDHFEVVRLVKTNIFALCAARREDLGPAAVVRGGYSNAAPVLARVTSQVYEVEGKLEISGSVRFFGADFGYHARFHPGLRRRAGSHSHPQPQGGKSRDVVQPRVHRHDGAPQPAGERG
jgi:hypothetical protein